MDATTQADTTTRTRAATHTSTVSFMDAPPSGAAATPVYAVDEPTRVHLDARTIARLADEHVRPRGLVGFLSAPCEFMCVARRAKVTLTRVRVLDVVLHTTLRYANIAIWAWASWGLWGSRNPVNGVGMGDFRFILPVLIMYSVIAVFVTMLYVLRPTAIEAIFVRVAQTFELLRRRELFRENPTDSSPFSSPAAHPAASVPLMLREESTDDGVAPAVTLTEVDVATRQHDRVLSLGTRTMTIAPPRDLERRTESLAARVDRVKLAAYKNARGGMFIACAINTVLAVIYLVMPGLEVQGWSYNVQLATSLVFAFTNFLVYACMLGVDVIDLNVALDLYNEMLDEYIDDLRHWRTRRARNGVLDLRWAVAVHREFRNAFRELCGMFFINGRLFSGSFITWFAFCAFMIAYTMPADNRLNVSWLYGVISTPFMLVGSTSALIAINKKLQRDIPTLANELLADAQTSDLAMSWSRALARPTRVLVHTPSLEVPTLTAHIFTARSQPHQVVNGGFTPSVTTTAMTLPPAPPSPSREAVQPMMQRVMVGDTTTAAVINALAESRGGAGQHPDTARLRRAVVEPDTGGDHPNDSDDEQRVRMDGSMAEPVMTTARARRRVPLVPFPAPTSEDLTATLPPGSVPVSAAPHPAFARTTAAAAGTTRPVVQLLTSPAPFPPKAAYAPAAPTEEDVQHTALLYQREIYILERYQHYVKHSDIGMHMLGMRVDSSLLLRIALLGTAVCVFVTHQCLIQIGVVHP